RISHVSGIFTAALPPSALPPQPGNSSAYSSGKVTVVLSPTSTAVNFSRSGTAMGVAEGVPQDVIQTFSARGDELGGEPLFDALGRHHQAELGGGGDEVVGRRVRRFHRGQDHHVEQ